MRTGVFSLVVSISSVFAGLVFGYADIEGLSVAQAARDQDRQNARTYIRTENYPRPPYSGATYYIYERDGEVICTKLEVCNKYDNCETVYKKGSFKDEIDVETGDPYHKTDPVAIAPAKLRRHVCLAKFKLIK